MMTIKGPLLLHVLYELVGFSHLNCFSASNANHRISANYAVTFTVMFRFILILITSVIVNQWVNVTGTSEDGNQQIRKKRYYEEEFADTCQHEINIEIGIETITSPDYPDLYPTNANCTWLLLAPIDQKIRLVISKLIIEESVGCSYDYLIIYDGHDRNSPVLGRYCGQQSDVVLETSSNQAFIAFVSDDNYEEAGFSLDYLLQTDSSCNASLIIDKEGIVTSPNYPSNYPDDMNCWIYLRATDDTAQIAYAFPVMDLEPSNICEFDFVAVFDGGNTGAQLLDHQCQDSLSRSVLSSGPELLVHFQSDHLLNSRGFVMKYSITTDFNPAKEGEYGACIWEMSLLNGTIASPGFPEKYEDGEECQFTLEVPIGQQIQLTISYLDLQEGDNCDFDSLEIRDGRTEESPLLDVLCGKLIKAKIITSSGNYMYVFFRSDGELTFNGFKAEYHAIGNIEASHAKDTNLDNDCEEASCNEVIKPIVVQSQPLNMSLHEGEWHSISCTTENQNDVVMWFKDLYYLHTGEEVITGVEKLPNNTLLIKNMNWKLEGIYTCVILSAAGTKSLSAWVLLDKSQDEPGKDCDIKFDYLPTDKALLEGGIAFLRCSAINADVMWMKDGQPLSSLVLPRVHVAIPGLVLFHRSRTDDSGIYSCRAIHRLTKCNATVDVRVEVSPMPADECGIPTLHQPSIEKPSHVHGRIVGGADAQHGAIPWQVMLWEKVTDAFCGGSLIGPRWVVSAAHCIALFEPLHKRKLEMNELFIKLGKHDRLFRDHDEVISGVENWIVHPNYDRHSFDNDIVLIRLERHISFTDYIKPICLGTPHYLRTRAYDNAGLTMGTVSGWGELKYQGERPRRLQMLQLPMQSKQICTASTSKMITDNMFCAGYAKATSHDACRGDSGGPFAVKLDQRWYLTGIVSWGEECGIPGKYGIYTKVGNFYQWIQDTMNAYDL